MTKLMTMLKAVFLLGLFFYFSAAAAETTTPSVVLGQVSVHVDVKPSINIHTHAGDAIIKNYSDFNQLLNALKRHEIEGAIVSLYQYTCGDFKQYSPVAIMDEKGDWHHSLLILKNLHNSFGTIAVPNFSIASQYALAQLPANDARKVIYYHDHLDALNAFKAGKASELIVWSALIKNLPSHSEIEGEIDEIPNDVLVVNSPIVNVNSLLNIAVALPKGQLRPGLDESGFEAIPQDFQAEKDRFLPYCEAAKN